MDLDGFISKVMNLEPIQENELMILFEIAQVILLQEGSVIPLNAPITICGDIHGQLHDLFHLFSISGDPKDSKYLFLGDYVDRGRYSLEVFCLLISYKVKYPNRFFLLRGNHECRQVNAHYGFYQQIVFSYGHPGPYHSCNELFDCLPIAALIDNQIYCVHGGLSPKLSLIEKLCFIDRRGELPSDGILSDVCWSDPEEIEGWDINQRGAGWLYGRRPTAEFCHINSLKFIARAHQLAMNGYQWHFDNQQLVTIWSAPNYMYRSRNIASVMKLDGDLNYTFLEFQEAPNQDGTVIEDLPLTYFQ